MGKGAIKKGLCPPPLLWTRLKNRCTLTVFKICIKIKCMKKNISLLCCIFLLCFVDAKLHAQPLQLWNQQASYPGAVGLKKTAFSIGNKAYIVGGASYSVASVGAVGTISSNARQDCWEFDPSNNTWSQKESFPALQLNQEDFSSFSVAGKGYVFGGSAPSGTTTRLYSPYMYSYDPSRNLWSFSSTVPWNIGRATGRKNVVGFSIGDKGYAGLGYDAYDNVYRNDFYEYDPPTKVWTKKAAFPGGARSGAVGFGIGKKGYVGTGKSVVKKTYSTGFTSSETVRYNDFWEWRSSPRRC